MAKRPVREAVRKDTSRIASAQAHPKNRDSLLLAGSFVRKKQKGRTRSKCMARSLAFCKEPATRPERPSISPPRRRLASRIKPAEKTRAKTTRRRDAKDDTMGLRKTNPSTAGNQ